MNTVLALALAGVLAGCGGEAPVDSACAWYQECGGECGSCDDGNPCTADTCLAGGRCGHVLISDACDCAPSCSLTEGTLTIVQRLRQGDGGLDRLAGVASVAISRDGRDIYVGARLAGAVSLVTRAGSAYALAASWPAGAVEALVLAGEERWLVVSEGPLAEGASEERETGLRFFVRASETGALTFASTAAGVFDGLSASADGRRVVATHDGTLYPFIFDGSAAPTAGPSVSRAELAGASRLVFSADGRHAYAASYDASLVVVLDANSLTTIATIGGQPGLGSPNALALFDDDSKIAVTGFCDSAVAVLGRDTATGELTWLGAYGTPNDTSELCATPEQGGVFAHPDAVIATGGPGEIAVMTGERAYFPMTFLRWDGALTAVSPLAERPERFDASSFDFVTDPVPRIAPPNPLDYRGLVGMARAGDTLVGVSAMTNAIGVVEARAGRQFLQRGDGGVDGLNCAVRLAISGNGERIWVAQRCSPSVGDMAIGERGTLTPGPALAVPELRAGEIVESITPIGDEAVVATVVSDAAPGIAYLSRDGTASRVALSACDGAAAFPVGLAAAPSGATVYVADFQANGKGCVHRATLAAGVLTAQETIADDRLLGAESLVVTTDGASVLTACHGAKGITELRPNAAGVIAVAASYPREDLLGAEFLALGPGDATVYVTSPVTKVVAAYRRDVDSGALTYLQTVPDSDAAPLDGAAGVVVSSDGRFVFVASRNENALAVLARDEAGMLTPFQAVSDVGEWPNGVAVTADGRHVYVASVRSASVSVLRAARSGDDGCFGPCTEARR